MPSRARVIRVPRRNRPLGTLKKGELRCLHYVGSFRALRRLRGVYQHVHGQSMTIALCFSLMHLLRPHSEATQLGFASCPPTLARRIVGCRAWRPK